MIPHTLTSPTRSKAIFTPQVFALHLRTTHMQDAQHFFFAFPPDLRYSAHSFLLRSHSLTQKWLDNGSGSSQHAQK